MAKSRWIMHKSGRVTSKYATLSDFPYPYPREIVARVSRLPCNRCSSCRKRWGRIRPGTSWLSRIWGSRISPRPRPPPPPPSGSEAPCRRVVSFSREVITRCRRLRVVLTMLAFCWTMFPGALLYNRSTKISNATPTSIFSFFALT